METFVETVLGIGGGCLLVESLEITFGPDLLKAADAGRGGAVLVPPLAPGGPLGGPPCGPPGEPLGGPPGGTPGSPPPTPGNFDRTLLDGRGGGPLVLAALMLGKGGGLFLSLLPSLQQSRCGQNFITEEQTLPGAAVDKGLQP